MTDIGRLKADVIQHLIWHGCMSEASATDRLCNAYNSEIETLRAALKLFLDDDRFKIAIGGNPVAVEKMLAFARSAYQGKVTICDSAPTEGE